MKDKHLDHIDFDFIRYANCWEDADVMLEALGTIEDEKVISIASAGDNCFSLLTKNPKTVIAVDVSRSQLALVELKKIMIQYLEYEEFLEFIGVLKNENRVEIYQNHKSHLSSNAQSFWDKNLHEVEKGIIHMGKFEKYFQLFKNEFLANIHGEEEVEELLRPKTSEQQAEFYNLTWNTPTWREMYKTFFGIEMLGEKGRDPNFLKHVEGNVADLILEREQNHLSAKQAQTNYFLHYMVKNEFQLPYLPHYLKKENFKVIKENIHRLILHFGYLETAIKENPGASCFNLSNVFEYMDETTFLSTAEYIFNHTPKNAKFVYWNLFVGRRMSDYTGLTLKPSIMKRLKQKDLGYFYHQVIVEYKQS